MHIDRITAFVFVSIMIPAFAYAATPAVVVPDHCTVADSAGGSHTFGPGSHLGICALDAANAQNAISGYTLDDFSFGLFLASLNSIVPSATQYWSISQNGTEAQAGLSELTVAEGDVLSFQLTDWAADTTVGAPIQFSVRLNPISPATQIGSSITLHDPFDLSLAVGYLWSMQRTDGSFDSLMLTDWAAIASAVGGTGDLRARLTAYETSHTPTLTSITDYERHAMALEALGIDPYTGTPIDVITPIVRAFDGTQVGDPSLANDDIFAIFPLLHAGYTAQDDIIAKIAAFIISKQRPNGSWEDSVDLTAAAIQALVLTRSTDAQTATQRALGYIRAQQGNDGGFGNSFTTSWVLQAIAAVDMIGEDWGHRSHKTPDYYLATMQERDGGVEPHTKNAATRVWATAYAIPAIRHKSWDELLSSFQKPTSAATSTETGLQIATMAIGPAQIAATVIEYEQSTAHQAERVEAAQAESAPPSPDTQVAAAAQADSGWWDVFCNAISSFFARWL